MTVKSVSPHAVCAVLLLLCCLGTARAMEFRMEEPRAILQENSRFPMLFSRNQALILLYQRVLNEQSSGGALQVEYRTSRDGRAWSEATPVGESVPYEGTAVPQVFSAFQDSSGSITVALARTGLETSVYRLAFNSPIPGTDFQELARLSSTTSLVSPRLFVRPDGSMLLFATYNSGLNLNIMFARSANGQQWSAWEPFETRLSNGVNINPYHISVKNRDYVVFQGLDPGKARTNQLYIRTSDDKGSSWSDPLQLSDFLIDGESADWKAYNNQRPHLSALGSGLLLLWERTGPDGVSQIARIVLNTSGKASEPATRMAGSKLGAFFPQYINIEGIERVLWFSNAEGNSLVYLSWMENDEWKSLPLSERSGAAAFPVAVVYRNRLHVVYHYRSNPVDKTARVFYVEPDQSAQPPRIASSGVVDGGRSRLSDQRFVLRPPQDVSGTAGYSWSFGRDRQAEVPKTVMSADGDALPLFQANSDGVWWLQARFVDGAGNWSEPSRFSFELDTVPPAAPLLAELLVDDQGFLASNSFRVGWDDATTNGLSYRYSLQYRSDLLGDITEDQLLAAAGPLMNDSGFARTNVENGMYELSVWAFDDVGNRSLATRARLMFNKFIPSTVITRLELTEDQIGDRYLSILGRGYLAEGRITDIILDRDRIEPYDYRFTLTDGEYRIVSDRRIEGLTFSEIVSGDYYFALNHSQRGLTYAAQRLSFPGQGVVKFGDYSLLPRQAYQFELPKPWSFAVHDLLLYLLLVLLALSVPILSFKLRSIGTEARELEVVVTALISGTMLPVNRRSLEVSAMRKQGLSLRLKFIMFFVSLVVAVVLLVAIPLSNYIITSQRSILAKGLQDRVAVVMESLASGAAGFLPTPDLYPTELFNLVNQAKALKESQYASISSFGVQDKSDINFIWASNDQELLREPNSQSVVAAELAQKYPVLVRTASELPFLTGNSVLQDSLTPLIKTYQQSLDEQARIQLGTVPEEFEKLAAELKTLFISSDPTAAQRRKEIDLERRSYLAKMNEVYRGISPLPLSIPAYDPDNYNALTRFYLFYKPVIYRKDGEFGSNAIYVRGMVRMGVSTDLINNAIDATVTTILANILIFAGIAVAAGFLGAFVLSSIIISPIRRLVRGVEAIRNAEDKESLLTFNVGITSKDELQTLGDVIDQMAHGLAKAAADTKELLVGKDVQKMFIPLEVISTDKKKGTTGIVNTKGSEIFGYYEGAKGVSGDYFNYIQLTSNQFALIKCDVAGKGVSASLIMVEVATLFLDYFDNWESKIKERKQIQKALGNKNFSDQPALNELVLHINDLVAEREFEGRFAALNIVLYNEETGSLAFCNAGDNKVSVYREAMRDLEIITLFNAPAAGNMSSKIFPIQFKQEYNKLETGDILLLYTDGIEEGQHRFLNSEWRHESVTQEDIDTGIVPPDTKINIEFEEMGSERIHDIIHAVRNREVYRLMKYKYPRSRDELLFDFTKAQDTAEDTVMALIAVEKVFRLVPNPACTNEHVIQVDKKVDAFLKKHFVQYQQYFNNPLPVQEQSLYNKFARLQEDPQYDDLTILAVRKK